jgi:GH18 family chitinase
MLARLFLTGVVLGTLSACKPSPTFRIIGYVTDAAVVSAIPYEKLTHINYAFLLPKDDGTFVPLNNGWKLDEIVERAHAQNVKVLVSVGGWGWDAQFETVAANPGKRAVFVRELVSIVDQYQLDGADIDWEYPDPGTSSQNFLALIRELRTALPKGKLLTAAVVAHGDEHGQGVLAEAFEVFDFINIMAYDGGQPHSSMELAETSLDYWLGRGLPPEKTVLGVPFYARPQEITYRKIVQADPAAADTDIFDYYGTKLNYNGVPTIQAKTRLAMQKASGIMVWELSQDAPGDLSLLNAIYTTVHGGTKP